MKWLELQAWAGAVIGIVYHGMKGGTRGVIRNAPPTRGTGRWGGLFALGHGDGLGVLGFLEGTVVALVHEEDGVGSRPKVCR